MLLLFQFCTKTSSSELLLLLSSVFSELCDNISSQVLFYYGCGLTTWLLNACWRCLLTVDSVSVDQTLWIIHRKLLTVLYRHSTLHVYSLWSVSVLWWLRQHTVSLSRFVIDGSDFVTGLPISILFGVWNRTTYSYWLHVHSYVSYYVIVILSVCLFVFVCLFVYQYVCLLTILRNN